jgi:NhaP-type Na+/H+ or K+/H+ antiporter
MAQMVLLAGPGVLLSTFLLGSAVKVRASRNDDTFFFFEGGNDILSQCFLTGVPQLTFPYNWSWKISLLLGGLLSATDPVAVVALLKELGASKKLSTIIEGESLMNDG